MGKAKIWFLATRPKTLPASLVPVLIGTAAAYSDSYFRPLYFAITLVCALFIQILTNFINEIYDFKKGADTKERLGPRRHVASGDISVKEMKAVSLVLALITFGLGLVIVFHAGWIILAVGISSLFFAYAYTGGPYPLAYNGLGDIFVFIFFGLIAVSGTYFVQALEISYASLIAGAAPGFLSMNILAVNNIRDIETDPKAGKITMAVKLGKKKAQALYVIISALAFAVPVILYILSENYYMLLPLISMPLAVKLCIGIYTKAGRELNSVLAGTAKLLLIHGLLMAVGYII